MKKIIIGFLCLVAAFFFTACGEPSDNGPHEPDTGGDIENPEESKFTITVDLGDGELVKLNLNIFNIYCFNSLTFSNIKLLRNTITI